MQHQCQRLELRICFSSHTSSLIGSFQAYDNDSLQVLNLTHICCHYSPIQLLYVSSSRMLLLISCCHISFSYLLKYENSTSSILLLLDQPSSHLIPFPLTATSDFTSPELLALGSRLAYLNILTHMGIGIHSLWNVL